MDRNSIWEGYVLIDGQGMLQGAFSESKSTVGGGLLLKQWVAAVRLSQGLQSERALINQHLARFRADPGQISSILEGIGLLLSKISVEPTDANAYLFLVHSAHAWWEAARKAEKPEQTAWARTTVKSAYRYFQDVKPGDERLLSLQRLVATVE
jgi:hypothetical protein